MLIVVHQEADTIVGTLQHFAISDLSTQWDAYLIDWRCHEEIPIERRHHLMARACVACRHVDRSLNTP